MISKKDFLIKRTMLNELNPAQYKRESIIRTSESKSIIGTNERATLFNSDTPLERAIVNIFLLEEFTKKNYLKHTLGLGMFRHELELSFLIYNLPKRDCINLGEIFFNNILSNKLITSPFSASEYKNTVKDFAFSSGLKIVSY